MIQIQVCYNLFPVFCPILFAGTQRPQIMPVIDSIIVTILPHDGQRVGTHSNDIRYPRGLGVAKFFVEHVRIGLGFHVLMSAAAGGTRASCTQQLKRINAGVSIVPCDRKFSF